MDYSWSKDESNDRVRSRIESWRQARKWINHHERLAREDPREFVSTFEFYVKRQRRHIRRFIRSRFGVGVHYGESMIGKPYIASLERFPVWFRLSREHRDLFHWLRAWTDLLAWFDVAWIAVISARVVARREGLDENAAIVENVFNYHREGPWMAAPTSETEPDPILRESYATNLSGWVGAQISLGINKRLKAVLSEDLRPGVSAFEKLVDELLTATIIAFDELQPGEPLSSGIGKTNLVSRVVSLIEDSGSEELRLDRDGKLSHGFTEATGRLADETGEEEFKQEETDEILRQRLEVLKFLIEEARLSNTEAKVLGLDLRTNFNTKAVVEEFGVAPGTVGTLRYRYRHKLAEAARSLNSRPPHL